MCSGGRSSLLAREMWALEFEPQIFPCAVDELPAEKT